MAQGVRSDLKGKPPSVRLQPRIPKTLHQKLKAEARRRDVSVNYIITQALKRWLDDPPSLDGGE